MWGSCRLKTRDLAETAARAPKERCVGCAREGSGASVLGPASKEPGPTLGSSWRTATSVKTSPRAERYCEHDCEGLTRSPAQFVLGY